MYRLIFRRPDLIVLPIAMYCGSRLGEGAAVIDFHPQPAPFQAGLLAGARRHTCSLNGAHRRSCKCR